MIYTKEGETVSIEKPLFEHPSPHFRREGVILLNGVWNFKKDKCAESPSEYKRKIVVPFAVETRLSGVMESVGKDDVLHYQRNFDLPIFKKGHRVILHFDAVDQVADVYVNKKFVMHHEGGYLPFEADITDFLLEKNSLEVKVKDDTESEIFARGKQKRRPGGIWYTPTSGIYQSVYLEIVPDTRILSCSFSPSIDRGIVTAVVMTNKTDAKGSISIRFSEKQVAFGEFLSGKPIEIKIQDPHLWSPEHPYLYDVTMQCEEDKVDSYFAMREVGKTVLDGHEVFALNGNPLFLSGLLDQGYYPESGLTPPSDQAMIEDIQRAKDLGFNMLRKHIKIEPMRWYYHCDRLGMLVIQDMVNGGSSYNPLVIAAGPFLHPRWNDCSPKVQKLLGRGNPNSRAQFEKDLLPTIERLSRFPCIVAWTLFNEGWGQFDAARLTNLIQEKDPSRLVDSTSGWCDQGVGDFDSHHIYFVKAKLKPAKGRILSLSEFGGYSFHDKNHSWNTRVFGYRLFKSMTKLNVAFEKLFEEQIIPLKKNGLSVSVLTQLTDVEDETNGLYTYDRKVCKADKKLFRRLNKELEFHD